MIEPLEAETRQAKRAGRSQRREGAKRPGRASSRARTWEGVQGLEGRAFGCSDVSGFLG